jgi:outer membrane protein OmpA-like peptidoglycan-associated protein
MRIPATFLFIFFILIFLSGNFLAAQNLVPNPGFEEHKKIPVTFCRTDKEFNATVTDWSMPNEATADYFHAECKGSASTIKNNFAGFQKAREGEAYAGIYCCLTPEINYTEYLKAKLVKPLVAGQRYIVQFYISLSESSQFAIDRFGVAFFKKFKEQENQFTLACNPTVESEDSIFYDNKTGWKQIRMSFIAEGGEKYMVIGNFHTNRGTHLKKVPFAKKKYPKENGSYYYIDNVCVAPEMEDGTCICPLEPASIDSVIVPVVKEDSVPVVKIETGKAVVLSFVFFDTDLAILKPESFNSLDSLAAFLLEEKKYFITITGHTDNSGDEIKNQKLSKDRAKAVADYLISKGINPDRIRPEGKGSEIPVADNATPEGRARNRRVEYTLHL